MNETKTGGLCGPSRSLGSVQLDSSNSRQSSTHTPGAQDAQRKPHFAFGDPEAVFAELERLMWSIGVLARNGEGYALLFYRAGFDHVLKQIRAGLSRAADLHGALQHGEVNDGLP